MEVDEGGGGTDREGKDGSNRERCLFVGVKGKKKSVAQKNSK